MRSFLCHWYIVGIVLDLMYFNVTLHMLWTSVLKGCCLFLQLACGLLNEIQTNLWQFPLYHNSGVLIAIFCGQQYQMHLRSPKTHYEHSSLDQVHLQFLSIGQILLKVVDFFWKPNWCFLIILLLSRKSKRLVSMGFTKILLQIFKTDIGL